MSTDINYCPSCGARRQSQLRYCGHCGFDFGTGLTDGYGFAEDKSTPGEPPPSEEAAQGKEVRRERTILHYWWTAAGVLLGFVIARINTGYSDDGQFYTPPHDATIAEFVFGLVICYCVEQVFGVGDRLVGRKSK